MTTSSGIWRIFAALSLSICEVSLGQQETASSSFAAVRSHPLDRYEPLWNSPLFSQPAPPEAEPPPPPPAATVYRLLGMGTTPERIELAYVQPIHGGRILEVTRSATSGPLLIGVERTSDGRVDAVVFRNGSEVIRAVASAGPVQSGEYTPPPRDVRPLLEERADVVRVPARIRSRTVALPSE